MGLASSVGTLNGELDKLIIGKFFSTEEYAIFANASKTLPVTILATSLTAVLLPKFVRLLKEERYEEAVSIWGSSINISFCVMCLIVGGFIVFAPDVMSLFYSEKYVTPDGIAVFRIYSLILLFRATYWGIVLNAMGKTKFIFYSSVATLALNCVGNILCYYTFGFIGPAIASLIVIALMNFTQLAVTCKILRRPFLKIFPWKRIGLFLIETAVIGSLFYMIKYWLLGDFSRLSSIIISIVLGVGWTCIYLIINIRFLIIDWKKLNRPECKELIEDSSADII
jgi:O-antigen/teichoic acid export membrane protein